MSDPRPLISEAGASRIKRLIRRASATVQRLQDPAATVTFFDGEVTIAPNVALIEISVDDRDQVVAGQGAIEESTIGTAFAWAEDVVAVRKGHRFGWDGRLCEVSSPPLPEQYGTVEIRFRILGGKP